MVSPEKAPEFKDDDELTSLKKSVLNSLDYYKALPPGTSFFVGAREVGVKELFATLDSLRKFLEKNPTAQELNEFVRQEFFIYQATTTAISTQTITFTAYYEHTLKASLAPTAQFRFPIYARPPDLVDARMENFDPRRKSERVVGRVSGKELVPYFTRKEIDSDKILQGKGLEIAWSKDPLDILFLQIQGSGWLEIADSTQTYHIRYAGDNGWPFRSVGLYLIETGVILRAEFSRAKLISYMSQLSDSDKQRILNQNQRYIFFELASSTNLTRGSLLVPLTAGRSIATDPKYYPQGGLAWIRTEKPVFDAKGNFLERKPLARFVLNQDEGGAIKGPHRIDFFAGGGQEAEWMAQRVMYPGELYFFIKKQEEDFKADQ